MKIRKLTESVGIDFKYKKSGYPHYYFVDDKSTSGVFELSGQRIRQMLDYAVSSDLSALKKGQSQATSIATPKSSAAFGSRRCHLAARKLLRALVPALPTRALSLDSICTCSATCDQRVRPVPI